jgi:TonB family protein
MSERSSSLPQKLLGGDNSSDLLLWLGALVVALVGVTWLVLAKPWSSGADSVPVPAVRTVTSTTSASTATKPEAQPAIAVEDWLRMGGLARQSGMLLEPADYSAWALFGRVLDADPGNAAAQEGLEAVAAALVERGQVALEQGRLTDAEELTRVISERLPEYAGVAALTTALADARSRASAARAERARVAAAETARRAGAQNTDVAPLQADPVADVYKSFELAMNESRLLTPSGDNAKQYLETLRTIGPQHELTQKALRVFFDQLLARAEPAIEALDTQAAKTWIDQAAALDVDGAAVESARQRLTARLIDGESKRLVPASDLAIATYVPPTYPQRASARGIEGWVDVEFTVGVDGVPKDVTVTDASNETLFRDEALEAVEQWRFEPRVFMGRTIEQRSFTRIRFAIQ